MRVVAIILVGLSTALSACTVQINTGTGGGEPVDTTVTVGPTTTGSVNDSSTTTIDSGGVSAQEARAAIVRVVAGPFTEPADMSSVESTTVSATGFFMDTSGAILTTNSAVAGAKSIEVYLADDPKPHPATVVAANECYDLAVVEIDDTDHGVLPLTSEEFTPGQHLTIGGYPIDADVYTITDAAVTTPTPTDQVPTASPDALISLYAPAWVGQAGAPVLTDDGRVGAMTVSISDDGTFAVPLSVVYQAIADLTGHSQETDPASIGLNTTSFHDPAGVIAPDGLWVRGVTPNSPADVAGILPGDVVVSIGGREMTSESAHSEYCLALHDHSGSGALSIVVFRPDDGRFYQGVIGGSSLEANGETWPTTTTTTTAPAATTTTILAQYPGPPGDDVGGFDWIKTTGSYLLAVDGTYTAYVDVDDAHGVIHSVKPDEWGLELSHDLIPVFPSVDGKTQSGLTLFVLGGDRIEEYATTWTSPGYEMGIAHRAPGTVWTPEMWVEGRDWSDRCLDDGIYGTYDGGTYTGVYRFWNQCETEYVDAVKLDIAAWNDDHSVVVWISALMFTDADYDAFAKALAAHTFNVDQLTAEGF